MQEDFKDMIAMLKFLNLKEHDIKKAMFFIDWKYVLIHGKQLFNVQWYLDINRRFNFEVEDKSLDNYISIILPEAKNLSEETIWVMNFVTEKFFRLHISELERLYYSLYPMIFINRGEELDIVDVALKYKEFIKENN